MSTTKEIIDFQENEGIYYVETFDLVSGEGTLTTEQVVFTSDADIADTDTDLLRAYHTKPTVVRIMNYK